MKARSLLIMMPLLLLSGCAGSSALMIKEGSCSVRTDIIQEFASGCALPPGYAELRIVSTLKTHKSGIYPFEKKLHGTSGYKLLVNVDGQAMQLQADLEDENSEPRGLVDPDAGDGTRYRFSKTIRLKAGAHKVIAAFPDDEVAAGGEFNLPGGSNNSLVVEPIYGDSPGSRRTLGYGRTSFKEGVERIRLVLNGQQIRRNVAE